MDECLGRWGENPVLVNAESGERDFYNSPYDRVSDVVENGVSFASKILTHNRMH